ncbi:MAG: CBS domain-containing protein [Gammaproteobacteria bacterium]
MMSTIGNILEINAPDEAGAVVWSVRSEQSVLDAIRLMAEKSIGAVLVIDERRLSGILSERDYARKVILQNRRSQDTAVREIMTRDVVTTTRARSVAECMALMTKNRFRHLPVVEDGAVLGIISIGDLVKAVIAEQQYTIDQLEHYIAG